MDTKPQTSEDNGPAERYRGRLLEYVNTLDVNLPVEEAAIARATELEAKKDPKDPARIKVPKKFVREILTGVAGIDQDTLKKGQVCRTGDVPTE